MTRFHCSMFMGLVVATSLGCGRAVPVGEMDETSCSDPGATKSASDGCNTCMCGNDGTWACTEMACDGGDGAAGSAGTASEEEGGAAGSPGTPSDNAGGVAGLGAGGESSAPLVGLPCDILEMAGQACVAAHSTVRALVSGYTGALYQVCKGDFSPGPNSCDGTSQDIGVENGYADAARHDAFCAGEPCTISKIYDQTLYGNDLEPAPPGGMKPTPANPADAGALPTMINGHSVYGLRFLPGQGYRKLFGNGTAVGDQPETIYMVTSQKDLINGCCFDYGNAETSANDDGNGCMEAVYFGQGVVWGSGNGAGPWVMADLENGVYAGWEDNQDQNISTNTALEHDFVTALIVGDTAEKNGGKGRFAIYGGDATAGGLRTMYDGIRPEKPGYVPMQKQGSVILSIGGDNSDSDGGRFYEGVMASGAATRQTINALQAGIVAARYGK